MMQHEATGSVCRYARAPLRILIVDDNIDAADNARIVFRANGP